MISVNMTILSRAFDSISVKTVFKESNSSLSSSLALKFVLLDF